LAGAAAAGEAGAEGTEVSLEAGEERLGAGKVTAAVARSEESVGVGRARAVWTGEGAVGARAAAQAGQALATAAVLAEEEAGAAAAAAAVAAAAAAGTRYRCRRMCSGIR
jgi:hypothetical protein